MTGDVEVLLLGPMELRVAGQVMLLSPLERALVTTLALAPGRVVSPERLIDALWGDSPPASARNRVQALVHSVRRWIGSALVTQPAGYSLAIDPQRVDTIVFEQRLAQAKSAAEDGKIAEAAEIYHAALDLWRGEPLDGVSGPQIPPETLRLREQRLTATEECLQAELSLGRHEALVGELGRHVADHPLRERLHGLLMLALYRCGRQPEALAVYRQFRERLGDELGLEPGDDLARLHHAILRREPSLEVAAPQQVRPAMTATPAQLPHAMSDFVGRAEALQTLDSLAGGPNADATMVITVVAGSAGVGKTALAVFWAQRARARYPDGQLYINLRGYASECPVRPLEAVTQFLRALGFPPERIPVDVDEASAAYRSMMADKRMLVVLDNAGSVDQVRALLPSAPGSLALITSRDRLSGLVARDGARRVSLDVLSQAEATSLITDIVGADRCKAEPDAVAELASTCGHLPLALRVAAAQLSDRLLWTIAEHVERLRTGDRLDALSLPGDTETAVRTAFDYSYATLASGVRRMFRLLGLVPGADFSVEAAEALAEGPAAQPLDRLESAYLIQQSGDSRYVLHDLHREYARQLARNEEPQEDRRAAQARLLEHYLRYAHAARRHIDPQGWMLAFEARFENDAVPRLHDRDSAMTWLEAERVNLVAALRLAAEHGHSSVAWQLAHELSAFYALRGYIDDWTVTHEIALAAVRCLDEPIGEATIRNKLGIAYMRQGRFAEAADQMQAALDLFRAAGDEPGEDMALNNLSSVSSTQGHYRQALDTLEAALALSRRRGDRYAEMIRLYNIGRSQERLGRFDAARRCYQELVSVGRQADVARAIGRGLERLGRLDADPALLAEALSLANETGDRPLESDVRNSMAIGMRAAGRFTEAADNHLRALDLNADTGDRAELLIEFAVTLAAMRDDARALECLTEALGLAEQRRYRHFEAEAHARIASLLETVEPDTAGRHRAAAAAIYGELDLPPNSDRIRNMGR